MTPFSISINDLFSWVILPILIFSARVCDVSLGTLRIIFISKGIKYFAPFIGFFELFIWLMAISQIFQNLTNFYYYFFYAGGFATGTFVGMMLEEKLSIGTVGIRIITKRDATQLIETLKKSKYGVTVVDAEGINGQVKIIFTVIKRQNLQDVIKLVKKFNPKAFYSIEDIRFVSEEALPHSINWRDKKYFKLLKIVRKGK